MNLIGRAVRFLAGSTNEWIYSPKLLMKYTHFTRNEVRNGLREMEKRLWTTRGADHVFLLGDAFPFAPRYFTKQDRRFIEQCQGWPVRLKPREISFLWTLFRHATPDRIASMSHLNIGKEAEWAKNAPSNINKTIRKLEEGRHLRVISAQETSGRWATNRYEFAGPSGLLPRTHKSLRQSTPKPGALQDAILRILERAKGPNGYEPVPTTQLINELGRHKKTIYFSAGSLVKRGLVDCIPQKDIIGRKLPHHWIRLENLPRVFPRFQIQASSKKRNPIYNWTIEESKIIRAHVTLPPKECAISLKNAKVRLPIDSPPPCFQKLESLPGQFDWPALLHTKGTRNWYYQVRYHYRK
jgi:hypothetical protein